MSRNELFLRAVDALQSGRCLELIGEHGSGRSFLLQRIREHFVGLGWNPVQVSGIESLRTSPLSALLVAGLLNNFDARRPQLALAFQAMQEVISADKTVLIIDDSDAVDDASWGVIDAVSSKHRVPFISSRLRHRPQHALVNPTSGYRSMYSMEIPPMGYRELERALEVSLDVKVEPSTMSRVFAKSGGNVGLATAIVDSAYRAGQLRSVDGYLVADGSLRTPALRTLTETILQPLDSDDLRALSTLSILGPIDIETVRKVIPEERLLSLEGRAFVSMVHSGTQRLVTVRLPLVVEYFNYDTTASQRAEILRRIDSALEDSRRQHSQGRESSDPATGIQLIHEMSRLRTMHASDDWHNSPTLEHAVKLLRALEVDAFHSSDEVAALLSTARGLSGSVEQRAVWELTQASYVALHGGGIEEAVGMLERAVVAIPSEAETFRARMFLNQAADGECPEQNPVEHMQWNELSELGRTEALVAKAYWLLIRGRVREADELLSEQSGSERSDPRLEFISIYCLIAQGRHEEASKAASHLLRQAEGDFDGSRIRLYAFLTALTSFMTRRLDEAERVIGLAAALGLPPGEAQQSFIGLTVLSAYFAAMRGQRALVSEYLAVLDAADLTDGPLPGAQKAYVYLRIALLDGRNADAAFIAREAADALWNRGARLSAAYLYIQGLLSLPSAETWAHAGPRLREIDADEIRRFSDVAEALVERDIPKLIEVLGSFNDWAREQADHFAQRAISALEFDDEIDLAAQLREATMGAASAQFVAPYVELSPREQEIASLIATGLSNPMVAEALALSVRTVESHINRLMKKLKVKRREEIRDHFLSSDVSL